MRIVINRDDTKAVYLQIFEQIRQQILSGELIPGFTLPPERKLAESLGVNRTTVLNAYRELKAEGLIDSRVGKGTIVLSYPDSELSNATHYEEPVWDHTFSQYSGQFDPFMLKELLAIANRKDVISFATGIASPESGPLQIFKGIEEEILNSNDYKALLHSPTEGFHSIRESVCQLMHKRGVYCGIEEVMLFSGSQQCIDIMARILLDPGDIVVVEEPSFFPAVQAFKSLGARVMGVPMDDKGMRLDILEQLLQRYRPKFIYTMPNFQNPTGLEMVLERRKGLYELARKYKVFIMEDDAYGDLSYDGMPLPLIKSMDNEGYVIYISTFSKSVYPGLRLGWMVAHKKIVQKCTALKQVMDIHSNSLSQWIIERFIRSGDFDKHMKKSCNDYRIKRDAMYEALLNYAPHDLKWHKPKGGYYFWCKLPNGILASKLVLKAAEYKVAFVPGSTFFTSGEGEEYIRLNFTFASVPEIDEGIKRLCKAIRDLKESSDDEEAFNNIEMNPIV
ncbi:DNA-binding transcriptional MocR family regulator [Natranaerovirga pectinivora]|uniref:DNA-binding transcriptional MocR family regulator n=1 Tax=Natranaerovirga pectinivora TaxID=682400 RepID=A0A4R3MSD3_9FIRM|nr:PLP-dependent aminotransferase family protein [Natranaerovirga pectinivora]TCT17138.1 DNA-binding transcriptional MocR family regulator [Natranaerovirga pectinivora]